MHSFIRAENLLFWGKIYAVLVQTCILIWGKSTAVLTGIVRLRMSPWPIYISYETKCILRVKWVVLYFHSTQPPLEQYRNGIIDHYQLVLNKEGLSKEDAVRNETIPGNVSNITFSGKICLVQVD